MCFSDDADLPVDSRPHLLGEHGDLVLTAADGNRFGAYRARAAAPSGAGIVVLPDVRGLHDFYRRLAERFAEAGVDAVAIDYFGRTAGIGDRSDEFVFRPHVDQSTPEGVAADVTAAMAFLRSDEGGAVQDIFSVGFCFGGSNSWTQATRPDLSGAIGFYGMPSRLPAGWAGAVQAPVLILGAGDDDHIPASAYEGLDQELTQAAKEHAMTVYPDAPHSFFDRRQEQFAEESADAWRRILSFIRDHASDGARPD